MAEDRGALSKRASLREVLVKLFGIGCIGFGGGSALIPVFQDRMVGTKDENGVVSQSELDDDIAIACITPGALPVEMSAGIGMQTNGAKGSLLGAGAIALPGVVLLVAILVFLSQMSDAVITQVNYLAIGISGYILSVISRYIETTVEKGRNTKAKAISILIIILAFVATGGKSFYKLIPIPGLSSILSIGTVNAMALTFFLACWIRDKRTPVRIIPALIIVAFYCLCVGKFGLLKGTPVANLLIALMAVMALCSIWGDSKEHHVHLHLENPKRMILMIVVSVVFALVLAIPAILLCGEAIPYVASGALSSILSFGGGDAYITMADGMFVETGMLPEDDFYSLLVPVANALPGSILCKVLTGTGYLIGFDYAGGSVAVGLAMALAGFACAIAMSCITFAVGYYFYEALEGLKGFETIKRVVGCVVSGLLLTVALGLLNSCNSGAPDVSMGGAIAIVACLVLAVVNFVLKRKFNLHPLILVIGSAVISCALCNVLAIM